MDFRKRLEDNEMIRKELSGWGIQFSSNLVNCSARNICDQIKIVSGNKEFPIRNSDWTRETNGLRMAVSVKLEKWIVLVPTGEYVKAREFIEEMKIVGKSQNFIIPEPTYVEMRSSRDSDYLKALKDNLESKAYSIAMVVMRHANTGTYKTIKKVGCCDIGVPTQVVTGKVLNKHKHAIKAIATKVMVQLAAKMGAEPWRIKSLFPFNPNKRRVVIGYDTYHDGKQSKAVGAFVASINESFTRYVSSVLLHENNEEISPNFRVHFNNCMKAYYNRNNKQLPTDIFFYRYGVGAGDIGRVKEFELGALKQAAREISGMLKVDFCPRIAYVIVSKRISTRFFQRNAENVSCGTVEDNTVTLADRYDFLLVSQKANRGTVSPTSYNIVEDTTGLTADEHQQLAYGLTHLYYNWTGNIRLPAPTQYAHKLAYLVGESGFQKPPMAHLNCLPYYL